ncbi:endopeptidase La [Campylobacter sputorum]|uniref:endopeptidase La n=1 Tax=Campylobacter sputorum TaxID=206 RepID=UPI00053BDE1D|nr:endopeptidase La [Campylobacter sputorum]
MISKIESLPMQISVLVEDNIFLYPFMITPIFIEDNENIEAINYAQENSKPILITTTKPQNDGSRDFDDIFDCGVIGNIMRRSTIPDGRVKILFQGIQKGRIIKQIQNTPLIAEVDAIEEILPEPNKVEALMNTLIEKVKTLNKFISYFPPELLKAIEENIDPIRICDLISSSLRLKKYLAYEFFIETKFEKKALRLIDYITEEIKSHKIEKDIKSKVHSRIEKVNKEYFLKEQLKQIQEELGTDNSKEEEIQEYKKKLETKKKFISTEAYKEIKKQIDKLSRLHPDSADAGMVQSYLDWTLEVPFEKISKQKSSIAQVSKQLNKDHYSLKKPKERIEEYFALRELIEKRKSDNKLNNGAIICFAGPPGVGKTSLANSIAKALKRELIRVALGGLEDVNELRGHRRTYIGAMPGRIVQGLIEAKQMNPVMVLDEIDKIGSGHRGDPSAVMLEILDPEQNSKFRDYYLNFDIDLSKIIFIATANDVSMIPPALRDRMEFIFLSSYTPQEKFEIAKKYLIPQEIQKHALSTKEVIFQNDAIELIISEYTRESGVRNLRRKIADILRKVAKNIVLSDNEIKKTTITKAKVKEYLEKKIFEIDEIKRAPQVGIVNGLAWTSVGGDVLKIEAIKIRGKGLLQLTGQLGDVMKESAQIAYSVVKVLIDEKYLKVPKNLIPKTQDEKNDDEIYHKYDLHLHVPEGATPKDGPSAGITIATAIASIFTNQKIRSDIAMTGEITLSGDVLPIGGLKEKLIAAHKAGVKLALIPQKNYDRDLDEIPDEVKKAIDIQPVKHIRDILKYAFTK